jgi:hypothetical protein
MRVTRAIKDYIELQVDQATNEKLEELLEKSKTWKEEHYKQIEKFEAVMADMLEKYTLKILLPKVKKLAPKDSTVYMNNYRNASSLEGMSEDEIFANKVAWLVANNFAYNCVNPYDEKISKYKKAVNSKVSEIILQLELGAKKEELEQMLSNINIEV